MADERQIIDIEGLSHYHAKSKIANDAAYVAKEAGKQLSQENFTTIEKQQLAQLVLNNGGGGNAEPTVDEVVVVTMTPTSMTSGTITEETASIIQANLNCIKPMFLRVEGMNAMFQHIGNGYFYGIRNERGTINVIVCDLNTRIGTLYAVTPSGEQVQADFAQNDPSQPDYVKNRTHYKEGIEIVWDGNENGREVAVETDDDFNWVKVYDIPFENIDDLIGGEIKLTQDGQEVAFSIKDSDIVKQPNGSSYVNVDILNVPILFNIVSASETITVDGEAFTFNSSGVYVFASDSGIFVSKVSAVTYVPLEDGYIPNTIPRLDDTGKLPLKYIAGLDELDDVIEGYYNVEDSLFYEDEEFTIAITGESGKLYLDKDTSKIYRSGGTTFGEVNVKEYTIATNADIDALFV